MLKYRQSHLFRPGIIGLVLLTLIIAIGLQPEQVTAWATTLRYQALFHEAGGLGTGNAVMVAGIKVGQVSDVTLDDGKARVSFVVDSSVRLGTQSTVHIRTGSLLGARILALEPAGTKRLKPSSTIPITQTSSPYSLNEAVTDLTTNIGGTDTESLNHSLDALTATLDQIAPQLGPTFDGLSRLSRSLNARSDTLAELFAHTSDVTGILAERSQQVNTLLLDGNSLLAVLVQRRQAISELLANTTAVARELSGVVADNEAQLAPTLDRLNSITAMLEKNRDNLSKALPGLKKFEITSGETVSNGAYYSAYVPNLSLPEAIQPFFDYVFGFRAGDPDMPRALFPPFRNGIPGGSR